MRFSCISFVLCAKILKFFFHSGADTSCTNPIRGMPAIIKSARRHSIKSITAKISAGSNSAAVISGKPCARYTSTCSTSCSTIFVRSPVLRSWKNPKGSFFKCSIIRIRKSVSALYAASCAFHTARYPHAAFKTKHASIAPASNAISRSESRPENAEAIK